MAVSDIRSPWPPFLLTPMDWDTLYRRVTGQEPATTVPEAGGECPE